MSAPTIELAEAEIDLLHEVHAGGIVFSRGKYLRRGFTGPDVSGPVQVLRAKKLVVMAEAPRHRIPPTRMCELTATGRAAIGIL